MNRLPENLENSPKSDPEDEDKGPNLFLLYGLLALALIAAMGFAVAIVWPFYIRR